MPPQSGARSAAGGAKARPRPLRPGFPPLAGWLLLLLHAVLLLWVASRQSVTFDESFHLPAGVRILARGDFITSYAQPPLAKTLAGAAALLAGARLPPDPVAGPGAERVLGRAVRRLDAAPCPP